METLDAYILRKLGALPQTEDGSAPTAKCLHCGFTHELFAIVKTPDGLWMCGHCYQDSLRVPVAVTLSWDDVRGVRSSLLSRSDWTQLGDIPQSTKDAWTTIRTALRDITINYPTPEAAMTELRRIEQTYFTITGASE